MLTPQQLLTTTDKPTPTTKEKLIIISITSFTTTPIRNSMIAADDNYKKMTIGNLVKSRINRIITTSIKIYTTILNMIIANLVFATLVIDLKKICLTVIEWNHVSKAHGLC